MSIGMIQWHTNSMRHTSFPHGKCVPTWRQGISLEYNRRGQTETIIFLRRLSESLKAKIMTVGSPRLLFSRLLGGKSYKKQSRYAYRQQDF